MVVVVTLSTGQQHRVDRNERLDKVAGQINNARGSGELIGLPNDATPSRTFWLDPDAVVSITDDGHPY